MIDEIYMRRILRPGVEWLIRSQKGDGWDNDNVFLLCASVSFFFHYKVT